MAINGLIVSISNCIKNKLSSKNDKFALTIVILVKYVWNYANLLGLQWLDLLAISFKKKLSYWYTTVHPQICNYCHRKRDAYYLLLHNTTNGHTCKKYNYQANIFRETVLSRYRKGPFKGHPDTPRTPQYLLWYGGV